MYFMFSVSAIIIFIADTENMELSCPLGIQVMSRKGHLSCYGVLSPIINPLLTKLVRSSWLDIGLVLFLRVYGLRRSRSP